MEYIELRNFLKKRCKELEQLFHAAQKDSPLETRMIGTTRGGYAGRRPTIAELIAGSRPRSVPLSYFDSRTVYCRALENLTPNNCKEILEALRDDLASQLSIIPELHNKELQIITEFLYPLAGMPLR